MDSYENRKPRQLVNRALDCITGLIYELSGTSDNDLIPDGAPLGIKRYHPGYRNRYCPTTQRAASKSLLLPSDRAD